MGQKCDKSSHLQQYECQITENGVAFDKCLKQELEHLWANGIKTIGSCCGHHDDSDTDTAYIQVIPEDETKMLEMGYKMFKNIYGNILFQIKTDIVKE